MGVTLFRLVGNYIHLVHETLKAPRHEYIYCRMELALVVAVVPLLKLRAF